MPHQLTNVISPLYKKWEIMPLNIIQYHAHINWSTRFRPYTKPTTSMLIMPPLSYFCKGGVGSSWLIEGGMIILITAEGHNCLRKLCTYTKTIKTLDNEISRLSCLCQLTQILPPLYKTKTIMFLNIRTIRTIMPHSVNQDNPPPIHKIRQSCPHAIINTVIPLRINQHSPVPIH